MWSMTASLINLPSLRNIFFYFFYIIIIDSNWNSYWLITSSYFVAYVLVNPYSYSVSIFEYVCTYNLNYKSTFFLSALFLLYGFLRTAQCMSYTQLKTIRYILVRREKSWEDSVFFNTVYKGLSLSQSYIVLCPFIKLEYVLPRAGRATHF